MVFSAVLLYCKNKRYIIVFKTINEARFEGRAMFFTSLLRDDLYQLVSLLWFHLQVVLRHGS